jgi:beta-glucanase (GH16 family)
MPSDVRAVPRWALASLLVLLNATRIWAFWTVDCGIVSVEKADPITSFGSINTHTHVVAGSAAFGQNATNADLRGPDTCTSCDVQQDKSAYWTNQLFIAPPAAQGKTEDEMRSLGAVPLPTKDGNAHIVYYKLITKDGERSNNDLNAWETIAPFPEDFKMKVTEGMIREKDAMAGNVFDHVVTYKCLGYGDQQDTVGFPDDPSQCTGGLRAQLTMPSCWNGESATDDDPSSHVAYPTGSWAGSTCPESHPIRIPTLFYEVLYDTSFIGEYLSKGWVLSYPLNERSESGDPLFHGDFMNGWDQAFLQQAINECGVTPCPMINKQFSSCIKNDNEEEPFIPEIPTQSCKKTKRRSKKWQLLFSDEFDGESLDLDKWSFDLGDGCQYGICAWGNEEFQYYTNSSKNAYLRDGKLVIHSRIETGEDLASLRNFCRSLCVENYGSEGNFDQAAIDSCAYKCDYQEISSARITTKNKFDFAPSSSPDDYKLIKVDMKIKTTSGQGLWPASWSLPTNNVYGKWAASGEIDFYESANDQSTAFGTIHYGGQWPGNTFYGKTTRSSPGVWHRVTFYWDECSMRWRFDGRQFSSARSGWGTADGWYSVPADGLPNNPNAPFDQENPFHLLFNQAVGGRFTGSVPYNAAAETLRLDPSATFEVDWVRVYGMI